MKGLKIRCIGLKKTRIRVPAYKFTCELCNRKASRFGTLTIAHLIAEHNLTEKEAHEQLDKSITEKIKL